MDAKLDQRFPSVTDMERAAYRRLPKFIRDYLFCGMGDGGAVRQNRATLDGIKLLPRYVQEPRQTACGTTLFGQTFDAPFGVAPVGMGGLAWPGAAVSLADAAKDHRVPFAAATFMLDSIETLRERAQSFGWLQFYRPNRPKIEADMLARAKAAGYGILIVTLDAPAPTRRNHDIRNGFSIPPRFNVRTGIELLTHPAWSLAMARSGIPRFANVERYVPEGLNQAETMQFLSDLVVGRTSPGVLEHLRREWPGKLVVKGVLDAEDARLCRDLGADGLIVSNHGGRQLEAAPSAIEMLPAVRQAVGPDLPLIADGGVRSGIDICRVLAMGADFVLIGRAFYYAVAAMGHKGADHAMNVLKAEFMAAMGQLGCHTVAELPGRLAPLQEHS